MHWLQTLDAGLFHFINRSLSNPLFDRIMPVLSGEGVMRWFVLAVVIAFVAALFGGARARRCALTMAMVSLLGNALVVNVIKHAVARPRPCLALPDVIERLGCSTSGSMPSAHAANWFSATMVAFLFYRKSWRFMLPMALAVSFSRVYNGVHYPGDVLAGAILGAGYAAAGIDRPCRRHGTGSGKNGFRSGTRKCHRSSIQSKVQSPKPKVRGRTMKCHRQSAIGNRKLSGFASARF